MARSGVASLSSLCWVAKAFCWQLKPKMKTERPFAVAAETTTASRGPCGGGVVGVEGR